MSVKKSLSNFFSATGAHIRKYAGQSSKRITTFRFIEARKHGNNAEMLHWLEAKILDSKTQKTSSSPLYKIFQHAVSTGQDNIYETHEITLDDKEFFEKAEALAMLEDWENEARMSSGTVILDKKQPLKALHFSRHLAQQ